ncbi:hypothetical protein CTAYLR_000608 [Chrysophaeum taylorii]|uniref:Uricase n=1 Tax=Chrysophaeum taylorii TaxID=2483200 RepID=A0AAD7UIR0_9STRA|nr:hypothetical protein CTAYLR_000608 [Chrysophaeum taylorii]
MFRRALLATLPPSAATAVCGEEQRLRSRDYRLAEHHHGKTRVRVLIRGASNQIAEYNVTTCLWGPYEHVFTKGDNTDLVATDTQKNLVYVVAKDKPETPEDFGLALAEKLLSYRALRKVEVRVEEVAWQRHNNHDHAFLRGAEVCKATVVSDRRRTSVESEAGFTFIKPSKSGFEGFMRDAYTLLPETRERCLASELRATWGCEGDFKKTRNDVLAVLKDGLFGPPKTGVYSPSLQNTIYDAACLVLDRVPGVSYVSIDTPNLHYLPAKILDALPGTSFSDDVFIPTSEPSGTIFCSVSRR